MAFYIIDNLIAIDRESEEYRRMLYSTAMVIIIKVMKKKLKRSILIIKGL